MFPVIPLAVIIGAVAPAAARPLFGVGPLCRDSKGLAKPCPPGTPARHHAAVSRAVPSATAASATGSPAPAGSTGVADGAPAPASPVPGKRRLFGVGRLCADSKGLAKPCPSR